MIIKACREVVGFFSDKFCTLKTNHLLIYIFAQKQFDEDTI